MTEGDRLPHAVSTGGSANQNGHFADEVQSHQVDLPGHPDASRSYQANQIDWKCCIGLYMVQEHSQTTICYQVLGVEQVSVDAKEGGNN